MVELKGEEKQNLPQKESSKGIRIKKRIRLLFLTIFILGTVGYFSVDEHWIEYVFAHLGGLSIIGLFGCFAGAISTKKGYGYWKAFLIVFILPIIIGTIVVIIFRPISCGGSISLAVAILIVAIYSFVKRSDRIKTINT